MAGNGYSISGWCDPAFNRVREAFAENFDQGLEVGASTALVTNGRVVADLWGGFTDEIRTNRWSYSTIVNMMSVAKGVAALAVHMLVDRNLLDLDAPVAKYWPEFAKNGKDGVLVRHVLDHRAGVPIVSKKMPAGSVYRWDVMIEALEDEPLMFEPGTQPAYHTVTMSFLIGELIRRVTAKSYGQFLEEEIAGPLGLDYHVGLPVEEHWRCARFLPWTGYNASDESEGTPPTELLIKAWAQFDPENDDGYNSPQFRQAQIPGVNGHGNARSVARLYGVLALGGACGGVSLLNKRAIKTAVECQWVDVEPVLTHDYRMGLGFTLNSPDAYMGPNENAFGHVGAGGSTGMCDPDAGIGFAYGMNMMHPHRDNGPRARRIIDAAYECI